MKPKEKVILDTNIFIKLDEDGVDPDLVRSTFEVYSTNAQLSEIQADKNINRQKRRLIYYNKISPTKLNLDSGIWLDKLTWDDDQPWRDEIGDVVEDVRGNSNKSNTWIDALIAEVAKENNLVLVTHESKIINRATRNGIKVLDYHEFKSLLNW